MVNKRVRNAVLGCNLKNDRMISVGFQGKPFNITVIEAYAPTSDTEEIDLNSSMKTYQRRQWHPTPVLLPGKSHGWRSLVGYSPWGCKESDMTERFHFHFNEDLQDLLKLASRKDVLYIIGDWNEKVGRHYQDICTPRHTWSNRQSGLGVQK